MPLRRSGDTTNDEIAGLSKGHMHMAKEFGAPVLLLSQLNGEVETRSSKDRRPQLSDLRGSGSIEQDAYGIMFVYRADQYRGPDEAKTGHAEIIVAKNRNAGTGIASVMFDEESTRFYDASSREYENADDFHDIGDEYAA